MNKKEDIIINNSDIQEIFTSMPSYAIKMGIYTMLFMMMLVTFLAWLIKYPYILAGKAVLITDNQPAKLTITTPGVIKRIYVKNNEQVTKGDRIIEIDNIVDEDTITNLTKNIASIEKAIKENKVLGIKGLLSINNNNMLRLHEAQKYYNQLTADLKYYIQFITNNKYIIDINNYKATIKEYESLLTVCQNKLLNGQEALKNASITYKAYQKIYENQGIPKLELLKEHKKYLHAVQELNDISSQIHNIKITINGLKKNYNITSIEYQQEITNIKNRIAENISFIKNYIQQWEKSYMIKAPFDGTINYIGIISENKFISSEQEIVAVIANGQNYKVHAILTSKGYGKIAKGQKAKIMIDAYPYNEYGYLKAIVKGIGIISNQNEYWVDLELTNGLTTTSGKTIKVITNMQGNAEIITNNERLLKRIIKLFIKVRNRDL